jgi:hypothetical protein
MPPSFGRPHSLTHGIGWATLIAGGLAACTSYGDAANSRPSAPPGAGQAQTVAASTPAPAPAPASLQRDAELSALLPAGAALGLVTRGDLDADGDDDALVVYAPASANDDTPRALQVLLRDAGGRLHASSTSPKAILCRRCGGMMGDPLQAIRIGRGEFTLRFEGGSRELWSSEFRFEPARAAGGWRLAGIVFSGFDRADGTSGEQRQGAVDFGDVPLEAFDPQAFAANDLARQ